MTTVMKMTWTREMVEILHMEMSRDMSWRRVRREGRQVSSQANPSCKIFVLSGESMIRLTWQFQLGKLLAGGR